ncbi:MAG: hypothetical protein IT241_07875, partial [Bacteroidia bacterium]|nr:hypothetical protein [Bacteroidia bacterium]
MKLLKAILLLLFALPLTVMAQSTGYLEMVGKVQQDGKGLEGVSIRIFKGSEPIDEIITANAGRFIFNLDLQNSYTLVFSKRGAITKSVIVDTKVPVENSSIIFSYEFKIDLFKVSEDEIQEAFPDKPVAKISFDPRYDDFNHDVKFADARKEEFQQIKKEQAAAVAKAAAEEKARQAAYAKAYHDSIARVQAEEKARLAALEKARQDSIAQAKAEQARLEKIRQDSIARAQAEEKARLAALEKARQDSIAEAKRLAELRAKFVADSIAQAQAEEKARLAALEKARQDSIAE